MEATNCLAFYVGHVRELADRIEKLNATIVQQATELGEQDSRIEEQETALQRIVQWSEAYPHQVFPEPDDAYLKNAREVLEANGMTLDRIAADCMRHVVEGVGKIAREALDEIEEDK